MTNSADLISVLERIAAALEQASPSQTKDSDFSKASAFVWQPGDSHFAPVPEINSIDPDLLVGIDRQKATLLANTLQFAKGYAANNALLWGTRGMGKSSLIKAVHAQLSSKHPALKLVEIHREDIKSLPDCLKIIRESPHRFVLFCDDLSFEPDDSSYKSLKAVLEGGIEGRPDNTIFYATSNRRHLMPRDMIENERSTAINPAEAVEEKVSLSDRFGLWIGFHNCSQKEYLRMVHNYVRYFKLEADEEQLNGEAIEWAATRGARSGRVAWQFIQDLAGRNGKRLGN